MATHAERDLDEDPYCAVWMEDMGGDDDERCERCRELLAGATPQHTIRVVAADGTVESDVTADQR